MLANLCENPNVVQLIRETLNKLDQKCWVNLCSNKQLFNDSDEKIKKFNIIRFFKRLNILE